MASPWTIPKLVTWRVKDWASCFLACKFPLDENDCGNHSNNIITSNSNYKFKRNKKKMTKSKRRERKLSLSPPPTRHFQHLRNTTAGTRSCSVSPADQRRLSWPPTRLSDDGFIVFCFDRDDDGFYVVKEDSIPDEKSTRTVNRKLIYGDQEVRREDKNSSKRTEHNNQKDDSSCHGDGEDASSDVHEKLEEEDESEEANASGGSSGSNPSDGGRGSFAFPVLGVEWMGSPVQMPKSDDLCSKKPKPLALGFQCCRF
ncbi:PREDICTED: protein BREAKING OF ASYMMETRY IN THE STOMATAL LINEAGE [Tarenaya hassleriana]|uniref:protein BREAKING OF ASYMMETRY IN THE STOMATAL LINEAGE n=1 Tax=Tarenaya hassleriana TaxID=28532 RepID=UPI00053C20A0|nr:PREDICTED: protein BREAKING OF ASYMMETRY IN THE STOMATAL LINEAGE [Tarenaya hassleriana]